MNTASRQAQTAADIEHIISENVRYANDFNGGHLPEFIEDYICNEDYAQLPDWADAAFSKKEGRIRAQKKHQDLRTEQQGQGFPVVSGVSSDFATPCDSAPLTNRGGTRYIKEQSGNTASLRLGGYDGGCEVGFDGYWDNKSFTALKEQLEKIKESSSETFQDIETEIGGQSVLVKPTGAKVGNNVYKFIFVFGGITFFIHSNPKAKIQPVRVRYSAAPLIQYSLFSLHKKVLEFLSSIGFLLTQEKISRLDLQVMIEHKAAALIKPVFNGCAVRRASVEKVIGKRGGVQTYTLGVGGRAELCIYDKKAELNECIIKDPVKFQLTVEHCIGEDWYWSERPLTRIEFRLWREVLRFFDISTINDLQNKERGLVDWLTLHWFRLLSKPKQRGHENTAELHPLWVEVRSAFHRWFSGTENQQAVEWKRPAPVSCDTTALEKQAAGCLAKAAALRFGRQKSKETTQRILHGLLDVYLLPMFEKVNVWVSKLEISRGIRLGVREVPAFADGCGFRNFDDWYYDFRLRR